MARMRSKPRVTRVWRTTGSNPRDCDVACGFGVFLFCAGHGGLGVGDRGGGKDRFRIDNRKKPALMAILKTICTIRYVSSTRPDLKYCSKHNELMA